MPYLPQLMSSSFYLVKKDVWSWFMAKCGKYYEELKMIFGSDVNKVFGVRIYCLVLDGL